MLVLDENERPDFLELKSSLPKELKPGSRIEEIRTLEERKSEKSYAIEQKYEDEKKVGELIGRDSLRLRESEPERKKSSEFFGAQ